MESTRTLFFISSCLNFFSRRRRHPIFDCDWSSDVCSSDLYLFDVDGTLVSARGAGRLALTQALVETFGTAGAVDRYDFRGKTDPRIVLDLMTAAGVAPAATHP